MVTIRKWPRDSANDHADLFASEDPKVIAGTLKRLAESSHCHESTPYDRAKAILSDHLARNGAVLSTRQSQVLDEVRDWLRDLFMVRG
jgi:hypothetical protein